MRKIIAIVTIVFLIINGLGINGFSKENAEYETENAIFSLSKPQIQNTDNDYIKVEIIEANSNLIKSGKPLLPIICKVFTFPLDTKILDVKVNFETETYNLNKKIVPCPQPIQLSSNNINEKENILVKDESVYNSNKLYPEKPYFIEIGTGLQNGEHVLFITVKVIPQYNPLENIIHIPDNIDIEINYILAEESSFKYDETDDFDMVIIAPSKFSLSLQPLIIHKNLHGVKTKLKTTESIYLESLLGKYDSQGRDDAEKIKYFIKYAIENWGITYVLLVGGRINQRFDWHVPVRYSNLHDRSFWNDTYISDLYYSDIYRYNESSLNYEFEDWDSNGNGIIGEWTWIWDSERGWWYDLDEKDVLDLHPDVYVGRLACRDKSDVRTVVSKIIRYENSAYDKDWFKNVVLVGGDTVPFSDGICEGEIENDLAASFLEPLGFNFTKLWVSNGELTGVKDVNKAIRAGSSFIYLSGHGTPIEWCTHPKQDGDTWVDLYAFQMKNLLNFNKLPICVVGGCHNSQFDVTILNMVKGILENGLQYFLWNDGIDIFRKWAWAPKCWSWNLVSQKNGGFIASIGNTGLGWGVGGRNCVNYSEGFLTSHFFEVYADLSEQGYHNLGMIHGEAINYYIEKFSPNNDEIDRKTIEQWVLLGDPSLRIGGYP